MEETPMRICESGVICCPRDGLVDFWRVQTDKWPLSFAEVVLSILGRQLLRICVLHQNLQVFWGTELSLSRLTIIPLIRIIVYNVHLLTAYTPSAIGPTLNCYLSECFGRAIFCCFGYEKSTRKVRARFNTSDIPLFKSDQHFRAQYYENEVDIFEITKSGRSNKQHHSTFARCTFPRFSAFNICNDFVSLCCLYLMLGRWCCWLLKLNRKSFDGELRGRLHKRGCP